VDGFLEFTIAQSPRNASSFSISSRILEKNGNTISRATLRDINVIAKRETPQ
jgi:hypothetical protein